MMEEQIRKSITEIFKRLQIHDDPDKYLDELEKDGKFLFAIEEKVKDVTEFRTKHFNSIYQLGKAYKIMQYAIIRSLKPDIVIETGVLHGLSSAFLLNSLFQNHKGQLVSIDKPATVDWVDRKVTEKGFVDSDNLPKGMDPGWSVPDYLRKNWTLKLGLSSEILQEVLDAKKCDYFVHDSEHSYKNMMFELSSAWQSLNPKGIIVCDNIDWCDAFSDFCQQNSLNPILVSEEGIIGIDKPRFGILRKN